MIMIKLYRVFDPALEGASNISFTIRLHTRENQAYTVMFLCSMESQ